MIFYAETVGVSPRGFSILLTSTSRRNTTQSLFLSSICRGRSNCGSGNDIWNGHRLISSSLPHHKKGCHLVTDTILKECQEGLKGVQVGIFVLNCLHTSAGLMVNENCDP